MRANASLCVQMRVYACICAYVCVNVCKCVYMRANACKYVYIRANACRCVYVCKCVANVCAQENLRVFWVFAISSRPSYSFRCVFVRNFHRRIQRTSRDEVSKMRNRQYFFRTETRGDEERGLLETQKNLGFPGHCL